MDPKCTTPGSGVILIKVFILTKHFILTKVLLLQSIQKMKQANKQKDKAEDVTTPEKLLKEGEEGDIWTHTRDETKKKTGKSHKRKHF